MSDFADTLWQAFGAESAEHLAAIEPLLVGLVETQAQHSTVPTLFRAFHSLKGLAAAMSRHGMEGVAHQAESLLGLARDEGAAVTDAMVDALLLATDELHKLRDAALQNRPDAPPPAKLMAELKLAVAGARVVSDPAEPDPPPDAAEPDEEPAVDPDEEMLGLYAEILRRDLPGLAAMLGADETRRAELTDTLETLAHGATVLEMEPLAQLFQAAAAELAARSMPLDEAGQAAMQPHLRELAEKAGFLSEVLGQGAGADELVSLLDASAPPLVPEALPGAVGNLADAMASGGDVAAEARHIAPLLRQWRVGGPEAQALLDLLGDICPRLASGSLPGTFRLATALSRLAVADLADEGAMPGLATVLRDALAPPDPAPTLKLHGPLIATLDHAQRAALDLALREGKRAYTLTLFLEETPAVASGLLVWLASIGQMPSNRSVFNGKEAWFEMLLVSETAPDTLMAGLLEHDPDLACVRLLRELREEGDVPMPFGPAPQASPAEPAIVERGGELRIQGAVVDRFMDAIADSRVRLAKLEALLGGAGLPPSHQDVEEQIERMAATLRQLHAAALETRIVPIDLALNRLPRIVRALAREQGKDVELLVEGRDVRVDKVIVDRLVEPLMHLVRNAIDHGIEQPEERERAGKPRRARLRIRSVQRVGEILLTVGDDGRGLNRERILARAVARGLVQPAAAASLPADAIDHLIFAPGFSTAEVLTETSGRGVGMDVVMTEVHRLGGEVGIESQPGLGTQFSLRLPLTSAVQTAVLVRAGGQCLAVAEAAVDHVAEVPREELVSLDGHVAYAVGGRHIPVLKLGALLWPGEPVAEPGPVARLLAVTRAGEVVAFEVEDILRRQELLLLRLHPALAACPCVGGAAVLGNGEVVLTLDLDSLMSAAVGQSWEAAAP